jgi:zinc protease
VERSVLANGLTVYAIRQGAVPIVTVDVVVDGASVREAAEKAGLGQLTVNALEGGAAGRDGAELAWAFEREGVELGVVAGWDDSHVIATLPVARLGAAVSLLGDVICEPTFPAAEVERLRGEQVAEILQRRQEPRSLANDFIARLLYGDDVAYGRHPVGLRSRLEPLGREDALAHHQACFAPHGVALVFVGDIDAATAFRLAESRFGRWTGRGAAAALRESAPRTAPAGVHLLDRPGSVQSEIRIGRVGASRQHPDYLALRVMNTLFGGAFTSRLNLNLREKHGFTYGVRSGWAFRRQPGPFVIQTAVATDVTARAVDEILTETRLLRADGARADEVRNAKDYMAGVFPLEMQTSRQMAARVTELFTHELPADTLATFRTRVEAVTADDVQRVAREHLDPGRFVIAVVGDAAAIRAPLEELAGSVTIHEMPE